MVSSNISTIVYCCYLDFLLMRITKVTTRTGDKGQTGLGNGERVSKNSLRVNAMGSVDKLNSIIGWARVEANKQSAQAVGQGDYDPEAVRDEIYYTIENGHIYLQCVTWGKVTKEKDYLFDSLRLTMLSMEFYNWIESQSNHQYEKF